MTLEKIGTGIVETAKNQWIWSAWLEHDGVWSFVYGCLAEIERGAGLLAKEARNLDSGFHLHLFDRVITGADAEIVLQALGFGRISLSPVLDQSLPDVPVAAERTTIHPALGHTAARIESHCSLAGLATLAPRTATWKGILTILERELGHRSQPTSRPMSAFRLLRLQPWLDQPSPVWIAADKPPTQESPDRGIRSLRIFRSEPFAEATHLAHVVGYGNRDRVLDRIVTLPPGETRSPHIDSPEAIDRFEFSLFDMTGQTLLHREVNSFLTEIDAVFSIPSGPQIQINDSLSRKVQQAGGRLAKDASLVTAHSSHRSRIGFRDGAKLRRHVSAMRNLAKSCFPPKSEDRWFRKSLDDEIGVISHLNTLLDGSSVREGILVDPFFGADALERLVLRLQSSDVSLTIVTSWAKTNPDTGRPLAAKTDPEEALRRALVRMAPFIIPHLRVVNLVAGNDQALHDRYLLLYPHEGAAKVYLLSNSINKMAGKWPYCMARLSDDIAHDLQDYIEGLARGEDVTGSTTPSLRVVWPPEA